MDDAKASLENGRQLRNVMQSSIRVSRFEMIIRACSADGTCVLSETTLRAPETDTRGVQRELSVCDRIAAIRN